MSRPAPETGEETGLNAWDYLEIQALVHRYADLLDQGDADGAGALFEHAGFFLDEQSEPISRSGENRMPQVFREWFRFFPERAGRPNTRHVTANLIVEQDSAGRVKAQSYVMVFQPVGASVRALMGATYRDRFEKAEGRWRFAERRLLAFSPN